MGNDARIFRRDICIIKIVLVLVVVLPTSPRRLKLLTSPRRLDSERLRQASREATSGKPGGYVGQAILESYYRSGAHQ
jgi:hypothetical protein